MTNEQKLEESLQTLATVNLYNQQNLPLPDEVKEHIKTILTTCKIGDDSEVINGIRHFKFSYQVPEADVIAGLKVVVECSCKGFMLNDEAQVRIENSSFEAMCWSDFWNANATANKLHEAAKQHYINHYSNAKPIANSEEVVNNILGINNSN